MYNLKFSYKKISAVALALITLLSCVLLVGSPVNAQTQMPSGTVNNWQDSGSKLLPSGVTPDVTVKSTAYLSFRPNPVGLGQTILVNVWVTPPLHEARYFKDFKITVIKPSGDTEVVTIDSFRADTTGYFERIADEQGTWKLKFDFQGAYFPAGNYSTTFGAVMYGVPQNFSFPQSCYYPPASTGFQELVVQKDPIYSWPWAALPTDYWTRPVSIENREWWSIAGHFPWRGPGGGSNWPANTNQYWGYGDRYKFTPWVQAPNTAHIAWKRQGAIGGLIGPITGNQPVEGWSSGGGNPSIIYAGRCYQTVTETDMATSSPATRTYWVCYDLRTGETIWKRPLYSGESAPSALMYYEGYPEVPGGEPRFGKDVHLVSLSGSRLITYYPWNGAVNLNVSISPLTSATYYMNAYFLSVQDLGSSAGANRYRLINWTIEAIPGAFLVSSTTYQMKIVGNITWPWSSLGTTWDMEAGIAVTTNPVTIPAVGAWYTTNCYAASLITGQQLWNKTYDETIYSSSATCADHGKVAFPTMDGYMLAINLNDGNVAWKSERQDYPWDSPGFGAYGSCSAYGLLYRFAYSGIYAFDWSTGKIAWKYEAPSNPYETPYITPNGTSVYSFNAAGLVADGKLFAYNTEHTPTQPITRGWGLHCINATTGEGIWKITGCTVPGAVADGYLVASDTYDGYTYAFGKGQSATTVTAPDIAVPQGTAVVIKGTVLDLSPAQPNTPCVSKESMTPQMEYLHVQHPIDGIYHNITMTGVPVTLTALDANGNYQDIGTVITDPYYGTFSKTWAPPIEGDYKIIASFTGDDSYGSSAASTEISVGASVATSAAPQQDIVPDYTMTIISAALAIIIAFAIGIAIAILILRKRQ
jgi:hypothetical protein